MTYCAKNNIVAVVVPIYKNNLNEHELISLTQCHKILSNYPIFYVTPPNVDLNPIEKIGNRFNVMHFAEEYFESLAGYNRLMLTADFYKAFNNYKYILIHQLDSFVFRDSLTEWCNAGYDYIGAPWVGIPPWSLKGCKLGAIRALFGLGPHMVGNGGFSLRKTKKFIFVLRIMKKRAKEWQTNEDIFWSQSVPSLIPNFRIPDVPTALKFAFEFELRTSYEMNQKELPFGCHAWERYDIDFWRPFIRHYGYDI